MPAGFSWTELGVDPARVRVIRDACLPSGAEYVRYRCMPNQRVPDNHALQAAIALGNRLGLPVVCYHALRPDYPHASDRLHGFVLQGLEEFGGALQARGVPCCLELPRKTRQHVPRLGALGKRAEPAQRKNFDLGPYLARYGGPDAARVKLPKQRRPGAFAGSGGV